MRELFGYDTLIEQFLNHEITVAQFERAYLDKYLNHSGFLEEELFQILDELFYFVHVYTELPIDEGEDPEEYVDEKRLRSESARLLKAIQNYQSKAGK
jgi:hypothetical protein